MWDNENKLLEDTADQGQKGINSAEPDGFCRDIWKWAACREPAGQELCSSTAYVQPASSGVCAPLCAHLVGCSIL